jgi:uncharacterized protein YbjT (DUF2867 family)
MAEIAEIIGKAIGKPVQYQSIDPEAHRRGMAAAGTSAFHGRRTGSPGR